MKKEGKTRRLAILGTFSCNDRLGGGPLAEQRSRQHLLVRHHQMLEPFVLGETPDHGEQVAHVGDRRGLD